MTKRADKPVMVRFNENEFKKVEKEFIASGIRSLAEFIRQKVLKGTSK